VSQPTSAPNTATSAPPLDAQVARLLGESKMIIVCGPGGVGKTTSAAALGVAAARHFDKRVLVLTVDPAKRLATALGLAALGNVEVPVQVASARGSLTMAMIDTKSSWDDMIHRHAPDDATRDRVLANDLYKTLTSRFVHSHDYVVTERLFDARESGKFDLVSSSLIRPPHVAHCPCSTPRAECSSSSAAVCSSC